MTDDDEQTAEEAERELREEGVDVDGFLARLHARLADDKARRRDEALAWMRSLPELPTGLLAAGCLHRDFAAPLRDLDVFAPGQRCMDRGITLNDIAELVLNRIYRWRL